MFGFFGVFSLFGCLVVVGDFLLWIIFWGGVCVYLFEAFLNIAHFYIPVCVPGNYSRCFKDTIY